MIIRDGKFGLDFGVEVTKREGSADEVDTGDVEPIVELIK